MKKEIEEKKIKTSQVWLQNTAFHINFIIDEKKLKKFSKWKTKKIKKVFEKYPIYTHYLKKIINKFALGSRVYFIENKFWVFFKLLKRITKNPVYLLLEALKIIEPALSLAIKKRRKRKSKKFTYYYIPKPLDSIARKNLALKWFFLEINKNDDMLQVIALIEKAKKKISKRKRKKLKRLKKKLQKKKIIKKNKSKKKKSGRKQDEEEEESVEKEKRWLSGNLRQRNIRLISEGKDPKTLIFSLRVLTCIFEIIFFKNSDIFVRRKEVYDTAIEMRSKAHYRW